MILVADSGSSKTDWILTGLKGTKIDFRTSGINPFFLSEKDIIKILQDVPEIQDVAEKVEEIYFFGAGCSSPDKHGVVSNALSSFFKNAFISVDNNMIGCAYATCGRDKGLSCILGTGSNISFFDGKDVHMGNHGLGYILGDEGSGTFFGKKLLTDFLYGKMPPDLQKQFFKEFPVDKESVIKNVYMQQRPNAYLASFAKFMSNAQQHEHVQNILYRGFDEFVKTHILPYPDYKIHSCHFVGSIAYHFRDTLAKVCRANSVKLGKVLKHPIEELSKFILSRENP